MKKIAGKIAWIIAVIGVVAIALSTSMIENYILFYTGWGMLIVGVIGTLFTNTKCKELIYGLLDFV